ncbi:hypothetical protein FE782_18900 [Paenibacillus antri]|uniref:DUF2092 domain-containing protein n=1 Tax=Paenibacillus antri TaxID=2582848 RepID=A0A5R9G337_9BACL|nr:hypothetical protein [Paenibacillus antri]TLS50767.1 hypothetical protein FE782_18900 [Paenibacillus antri]
MMKKSKVLMVGAAIGAVSLFAVTALASTPNTAGYDAFKAVLKANQQAEDTFASAAIDGRFTIAADGETILTADGTTKMRHAGDAPTASSEFDFTLLGIERAGSMYYGHGESAYFVDRTHDLHYQVINLDHGQVNEHEWRQEGEHHDRPMTKAEEALLDYMVGDLKNEFSVTNHADGTKTISVDVSKDEIPVPLQLLMDVAAAGDRNERTNAPEPTEEWERIKQFPFFQGLEEGLNLEEHLPELTDDVALERVQLQLTVDANDKLLSVQGELEVSGKDEAGDLHRVEIEGAGEISGVNATTPDAYDPSGKSVEIVDAASFGDRN